jgi:hypothetical protein
MNLPVVLTFEAAALRRRFFASFTLPQSFCSCASQLVAYLRV